MNKEIKKSITLPLDLARYAENEAEARGVTVSRIIQDALSQTRIKRRLQKFRAIQGYWSQKARDKGILSGSEMEYLLRE